MKPLTFKSSEMIHPGGMIILLAKDNSWLQLGDIVISAWKEGGNLFASGESLPAKVSGNPPQLGAITKVWTDSDDTAIKDGLWAGEEVYWGLYRNGVVYQLSITTYVDGGLTLGIGTLSDEEIVIEDNPYYSLNPVWTDETDFSLIVTPVLNTKYTFYKAIPYDTMLPDYMTKINFEINEPGIKVSKSVSSKGVVFFNSSTITFTTKEAIDKGYFDFKVFGTPLANSASDAVFKIFKLSW